MEEIVPEDLLYRRIFRYWFVEDQDRVSSAAFKDRKGKSEPALSVYLARLESVQRVLDLGVPGQGVVSLVANAALSLGLAVRHDPLPESYGHCLIVGATTPEQCANLASACRIEVAPPRRA